MIKSIKLKDESWRPFYNYSIDPLYLLLNTENVLKQNNASEHLLNRLEFDYPSTISKNANSYTVSIKKQLSGTKYNPNWMAYSGIIQYINQTVETLIPLKLLIVKPSIIINSGSYEKELEAIKNWQTSDNNILYIRNKGHSKEFNTYCYLDKNALLKGLSSDVFLNSIYYHCLPIISPKYRTTAADSNILPFRSFTDTFPINVLLMRLEQVNNIKEQVKTYLYLDISTNKIELRAEIFNRDLFPPEPKPVSLIDLSIMDDMLTGE